MAPQSGRGTNRGATYDESAETSRRRTNFPRIQSRPTKEHADWANWALLFRLEEEGRQREVLERAFDLWDGGFLEDEEAQRELQRVYEISRKPEQ